MYLSTPNGVVELSVTPNTGDGQLFSNVSENGKRGLPAVIEGGVPAVICGGGPSLGDAGSLEKIRELQAQGAKVFALNNAARFLAVRGIEVDGQILLDARPQNVEFIKDTPAKMLYLASQCDPSLFDEASRQHKTVMIWHARMEGMEKHLPPHEFSSIGGGTTVGLSGMCLVYTLGFRVLHLFGYDSSYRDDDSHAYGQDLNKGDDRIRTAINNRVFSSSVAMAQQANKFMTWASALGEMGAKVNVHGDGLLPYIVQTEAEKALVKPMIAVYDLGGSPPSYDFVTFLSEAENARAESGFTCIDIVFQPGPIGGFRDDIFPPDVAERNGMLWRVCVPMCRLLPSVRNVEVLQERKDMVAHFPVGWSYGTPKAHYGWSCFERAKQVLRATESGKRHAARIAGGEKYVTITLRQAPYHDWRNSNLETWLAVAKYFEEYNYKVIIIPDTNGCAITNRKLCWEGAFDIDIRFALYQGAFLNLGVANGPTTMFVVQGAPFLMFVPYLEDSNTKFGIPDGEEEYARGKVIYGGDAPDFVIAQIRKFLEQTFLQFTAKAAA